MSSVLCIGPPYNARVTVSNTCHLDTVTLVDYRPVMLTNRMTEAQEDLLVRLMSKRKLPTAAERRRIRENAGCSLRDIAAVVGVSQMAVVRWEQGAQPRKPEHLLAYGRLLDELRRLTTEGGDAD